MPFTIWLDADGAPRGCKEILFRTAIQRGVNLVVVANRWQQVPDSPWIRFQQVSAGLDVADDHIAARCQPGDIVVTSDVPLAAEVIAAGAVVLQHRGEELDESNVRQRLAMRDLLTELRASGLGGGGGPPPYGRNDRIRFSNALDRLLARASS